MWGRTVNASHQPEAENDDDNPDFSDWPLLDFALNAPASSCYVARVYRGDEYRDVLDLLQRTRDSALYHFFEETSRLPLTGMFEGATRIIFFAPEIDGVRETLADVRFD